MVASFMSSCEAFLKRRQRRSSPAAALSADQASHGAPEVIACRPRARVRHGLSKILFCISGLASPAFLLSALPIGLYFLLWVDSRILGLEAQDIGAPTPIRGEPQAAYPQSDNSLLKIRQPERSTCLLLAGSNISDRGIEVLHKAPHMAVLELSHTNVTGASLRVIGGLKELEGLFLRYVVVMDDDLIHLKGSDLRVLDLAGTLVTDAGLQHLLAVPELEHLFLDDAAVTDRGLAIVQKMANLRSLRVRGTAVTAQGVLALKAARSDIEILCDDRAAIP